MNIYYQNEFYGKEIAYSIARYSTFCLNLKNIKLHEIRCGIGLKIIDNLDNTIVLLLTNRDHDCTYWITLVNNIISDIGESDSYINIVDLTWQTSLPISVFPGEMISISEYGCKNWLSELTSEFLKQKNSIRLKDEYIKGCYNFVKHEVFGKKNYGSIEEFIDYFRWSNLKNILLKTWRE